MEEDLAALKECRPYNLNLLLMLFEKHLSNVPSITLEIIKEGKEEIRKHPDISLFYHSKMTAAIAGCMYRYYTELYPDKWKKGLLKDEILNPSPEVEPYLLIGGDISGIQKFIYTITSKGALKSLKGRSFYIELLAEHTISELIDALELTRCNIIFSGGGHFYILSYNTQRAIDAISKVKEEINNFLFENFKGSLQLHIESVSFNKKGFERADSLWSALSEKLQNSKKKKWENKLHIALAVEAPHFDCLTESCKICFREDIPLVDLKRQEETIKVCNPCNEQYELGSELSNISKDNYPVIYKIEEEEEKSLENGIKLGQYYYRIMKKDVPSAQKIKAIYRINDYNAKHYSNENAIYIPLGVYQHEDIHEISDASSVFGINRIAVLRMDVDNLGKIFSTSVSEEDRTFSRMASISRGLNQFFKYCLNDIVEGKEINPSDIVGRDVKKKGRKLSIVYAGGDDLFIIGHWLEVLEAAYDIKRYFEQYTGNKFITISGGIAMNYENYPVYQFARDAAEAEEIAKGGEKDSVTIWGGRCFKWQMFEKLIERIQLFKRFLKVEKDSFVIDETKLPKTFFYRLLALARRFNEEGVLVLPKAAYLISRAKFKNSDEKDILKIKEVVMNVDDEEWHITEAATLITLMLMRKGGMNDE